LSFYLGYVSAKYKTKVSAGYLQYFFNHLENLWTVMHIFAILDEKTNHIIQLFLNKILFQNIEAELNQTETSIGVVLLLQANLCLLTN